MDTHTTPQSANCQHCPSPFPTPSLGTPKVYKLQAQVLWQTASTDSSLKDTHDENDVGSSADSNYSALQDNPRLALRRFIVFIAGTATVAELKRKTEAIYHDLYPQDPKVRVTWVQDNSFYDLADSYQVADVFSDSHAFFATVELANVNDAPRVDMAQIVANHRRTATEQLLYASPVASGPVSPHVSLLSTKRSASPIAHDALKRIKVTHHSSPSPALSRNTVSRNPATAAETPTHPGSSQIRMGSLTSTTTMVTPLASSPEISANPLFETIEQKPAAIPTTTDITPVSQSGESQTGPPLASSRQQGENNMGNDNLKAPSKTHLDSSSSDSDTSSESESSDTTDTPDFPTTRNDKPVPLSQVSAGHKPQNAVQTSKPIKPLVAPSNATEGRRSNTDDSSSDEDGGDSDALSSPKLASTEAPRLSAGTSSKNDRSSPNICPAKPPMSSSSSSSSSESDSDASAPVQSLHANAIATAVKTSDRPQSPLVQPNAAKPAPTSSITSRSRAPFSDSDTDQDSDSDSDAPPTRKQIKPQPRVVPTVKQTNKPAGPQKRTETSSSDSDSTSSSSESDSDGEPLAKAPTARFKAQGEKLTPNPKSATLSTSKSKITSASAGVDSDSDSDSFDKSSSLASARAPYGTKGATATKPGGFTSLSAMAASGKFHKLSTSSQLIPGIPSSTISRALSRSRPSAQSSSESESSSDDKAVSDDSDTSSDSDDSGDDETPKAPSSFQPKGTFQIKFAQSASKKKKKSSKSRLRSLAF